MENENSPGGHQTGATGLEAAGPSHLAVRTCEGPILSKVPE